MPTYTFRCPECDLETEARLSMEDRNTAPSCSECDVIMKRVYDGHAVIRVPNPLSRYGDGKDKRKMNPFYKV